jgi:hypothetical protein
MKKHLVLFSVFILLVFGGCKNPAGNHPASSPANPPAPGFGKVSVQVAGELAGLGSARTVFPTMAFDRYTYTFTAEGRPPTEKIPDSGGVFTLEVGEYTVAVKAYIEVEGAATLAASGVSAAFIVAEGDNEPVTVRLAAVTSGLGEFSYIVTYPPDAVGDIALYSYPGMVDMGLAPSHVCEANGVTEWVELEAGTYLLTVSVKMGSRYAGITEAIHIAPYLATYYDRDFVEEDFTGTLPAIMGGIRFVYFWIDEHGELLTTSNGALHINNGETLAITAQGEGYSVRGWYVNGIDSGQNSDTYLFSSETAGRHTVGLLVEKNGKLYNSNIVITVEGAVSLTRSVTVDMYAFAGNGWSGNAAIKIVVNGVIIDEGVKVNLAQNNTNTYTFTVSAGDVVQFYWVAGTYQSNYSFIAYYTDTPPIPAFTTDNKGTFNWDGSNALLYRVRGTAPAGLLNVNDGTLLGEFTVTVPVTQNG